MNAPASPPFTRLPVDARTHFTLHFYGAVLHLLGYIESLGEEEMRKWHDRYPFLRRYADEVRTQLGSDDRDAAAVPKRWWETVAAWEAASPERFPLRSLQRSGDLSAEHITALVLAGLPEEDSRFGTVFAQLQEPLAFRLLGMEIGSQIMGRIVGGNGSGWAVFEALVAAGLLRIANPEAPRAEWLLKAPPTVWKALRGEAIEGVENGLRFSPPNSFPAIDELILPRELAAAVRRLPNLMADGVAGAVLLRGMEGSGREEILGAMAQSMGRSLLVVEGDDGTLPKQAWSELGPLCLLTGSLPVIRLNPGPGQTFDLSSLKGYRGPLGIVLGAEGGVRGSVFRRPVTLTVPQTRFAERRAHWQRRLDGRRVDDLDAIAERFHLPAAHIKNVASVAVTRAGLNGGTVSLCDVRLACRELGHQRLNSLAERLETTGHWGDLVVPPGTERKLIELENRCRRREELLEHLGSAFRSNNAGVRALFTGPSGTGKTLAAKLLSAVLEMDIYRVDLASVINKYIGETEKNLHRVLSRAEELDVILLLDEGDSLLGNRTEVRSANDRYANLETNYLLQRLENYQGIVVVTTNVGSQIDSAFKRRMDVVVEFTRPGPDERRQIWELHLPDCHKINGKFIAEAARRLHFTGGQIRNTVAAATLQALSSGDAILQDWHLREAIHGECRKGGILMSELCIERREPASGGMEGFLA